ncbi:6,7-dimethyl-8-ribityllumazine synthase [Miltoncostaea marina]|uniref:6,7-dimethyl-8-ribityllumazine synthase n=1 Tax=Miltoncostaea marina TaxID=2843215 RepID=UPI001C3C9164|nr:6,7-dimethyl-8-ribityllumazine synthase [Miltoncostaea marina]
MARTGPPPPAPRLEHPGVRMAAVVAGFHRDLAERLLEGARARLAEAGLPEGHLEDHWVPGAFELPLAARSLALRRRYAGIVALGVVIRGETAHFDHICHAASTGLMAVGLETGVPCAFGVLTTEDRAQAEARSGGDKGNAGSDAADAAVVMANLLAEGR